MIIGYFADGPWAHNAMDILLKNSSYEIAFVCLRFDNQDNVLQKKAKDAGIPCFSVKNINHKDFLEKIIRFNCDLFVSMSFNQIFREEIIMMPKEGIINCHAGLLPFYRGRNILNWALINDEKEFGITVHYVDSGIDTDILNNAFPISDQDDYSTLLRCAYENCADLLVSSIDQIHCGKASRTQIEKHPVGSYNVRKTGDERN